MRRQHRPTARRTHRKVLADDDIGCQSLQTGNIQLVKRPGAVFHLRVDITGRSVLVDQCAGQDRQMRPITVATVTDPHKKSPAPKAAIMSVALGSKETTRGLSVSVMGTVCFVFVLL